MNKKMRAKILAGLLYKTDRVIKESSGEELALLQDIRDKIVAQMLLEAMGVSGYDEDNIHFVLSGEDMVVPAAGVKKILGKNYDAVVERNYSLYRDKFKTRDTEPAHKETNNALLKPETVHGGSDNNILLFTPDSQTPKDNIQEDSFDDDFFLIDVNEYEPPEKKDKMEKEEKQEKPQQRRISDEEFLEQMMREMSDQNDADMPSPDVITFGNDDTEAQEDTEIIPTDEPDTEKEKRSEEPDITAGDTSAISSVFHTEEETDDSIPDDILLFETPEKIKDTGDEISDDDLLFGFTESIDPDEPEKISKESEPDGQLFDKSYTPDNKKPDAPGPDEESDGDSCKLNEDEDVLFSNDEEETVSPEKETSDPGREKEPLNEPDVGLFDETSPDTHLSECSDSKNTLPEDDQEEIKTKDESDSSSDEDLLAELKAHKEERRNVFLNLLLSLTEDKDEISPVDSEQTDVPSENEPEDTYELLYKFEKTDFSYDTIEKDGFLCDTYEFKHNNTKYKATVIPIQIPKKDGACIICLAVETDDSVAVKVSEGNFKIVNVKIDDMDIYATGILTNRHFSSNINIHGSDGRVESTKKSVIRPLSGEYGNYGHNLLNIDFADTLHIFPLDLKGESNDAIAVLKKDYGSRTEYEAYWLKDGKIDRIRTDDGDYKLICQWDEEAYTADAEKIETVRKRERLF